MSGEWTLEKDRVVFTPKYPLQSGTKFRVLGIDKGLSVQSPKAEKSKATIVTRILPETAEIPENILRFYIEFNQPMPRGNVYDYVNLFTDSGKKVEWPFLRLEDELWNTDQTRLTLLIDPGRIKKEVKPRIDLGPVFMAKGKYTLVVSGKWPTLSGETLGADVRKSILSQPPMNAAIDPKSWKLTVPTAKSTVFRVDFDRPMDRPLTLRCLEVFGPKGEMVVGKSEFTDKSWSIEAKGRWRPGNYTLRIDPALEDVCGNRVGQPFEVDLEKPKPKEVKATQVEVTFTVR